MHRFIIRNRDVKLVKAKDFDNAAFERGEFDIVMCSPESVRKTLRFLSEQGYMWGCSKTSLLKDTRMKERLLEIIGNEPVYITIDDDVPNGVLLSSAYLLYTSGAVEIDFKEDNVKEIKRIKPEEFDLAAFDKGKIAIVVDNEDPKELDEVLSILDKNGYTWLFSSNKITDKNSYTYKSLRSISFPFYLSVGGFELYCHNGIIWSVQPTTNETLIRINFKEDNMIEVKQVKTKDFDSEAFQNRAFRIAICSPKSMSRTLQFLHDKGYMWGNTKTSLLEDGHMREVLLDTIQRHPVFIVAGGHMRYGVVRDIMSSPNIPTVELIFEETSNDKIVITNDGKTTTATLYSNGKKSGVGTAICHDDDKFDVYAGAKLALDRLERYKKEPEMTDWEKFVKSKVNLRVPKKYIRNFLDRAARDDLGIFGSLSGWYLRCLEQDGDSIVVFVDHKSKKYIILTEDLRIDHRTRTVDYIPGMK